MKKILIQSMDMELGGVERSLVAMLDAFDFSRVEVDLFLLRHEGALLRFIPKEVNLLPQVDAYSCLGVSAKTALKKRCFPILFGRMVGKFFAKIYDRVHKYTDSFVALEYSHKYTAGLLPKIEPKKEYDLAISFSTPHYFVTEKVQAKQKIAWIHTDYSTVQVNKKSELKMWSRYDCIASISDSCTTSFLSVFPELEDKIINIENMISTEFIRHHADVALAQDMPEITGEIRICSVGRFCHAKNYDSIPEIVRQLNSTGIKFRWYLIGFGGDESLIRAKIAESKVEDQVIILGKRANPYPYMKACDIYVQPSRYEGKAVTVREAQILGKPVLITNFPTAKNQLEDGVDGMICPLSIDGVVDGIRKLVNDKELRGKLASTAAARDYSNRAEVDKIYQILH